MKIVAILPAKGTSSRVASKNMKLLLGKPLFQHTLEKLLSCQFIDEVYIDSESDEILDIGTKLGANPLRRDPSLATNATDGHKLFMNGVNKVEADIYIQILGTSPFIKPETILAGIEAIKNNDQYDSAVLVQNEKLYLWDEKGPKYDIQNVPNSVDLDTTLIETMGLYIVKREAAHKLQRRIGDNVFKIEADKVEAIDIDYEEDFALVESILEAQNLKEATKFNLVSKFLSAPILSDVLDDLGLNGFVEGISVTSIPGSKILGRATTLKLRKLNDGEDFHGIYDALNTYQAMNHGQIIFVDNSDTEYAYFGGLNGSLAVAKGIRGVVINGRTRDKSDVDNLALPVFSKGYIGKDVRMRATMESYNQPITVSGVTINHNDLIYADSEGVIAIPKEHETLVLTKALEKVSVEGNIVSDILNGRDIKEILDRNGNF